MAALEDHDLTPYMRPMGRPRSARIPFSETVRKLREEQAAREEAEALQEGPRISRLERTDEERDLESAKQPEAALPWTEAGAAAMRLRARQADLERRKASEAAAVRADPFLQQFVPNPFAPRDEAEMRQAGYTREALDPRDEEGTGLRSLASAPARRARTHQKLGEFFKAAEEEGGFEAPQTPQRVAWNAMANLYSLPIGSAFGIGAGQTGKEKVSGAMLPIGEYLSSLGQGEVGERNREAWAKRLAARTDIGEEAADKISQAIMFSGSLLGPAEIGRLTGLLPGRASRVAKAAIETLAEFGPGEGGPSAIFSPAGKATQEEFAAAAKGFGTERKLSEFEQLWARPVAENIFRSQEGSVTPLMEEQTAARPVPSRSPGPRPAEAADIFAPAGRESKAAPLAEIETKTAASLAPGDVFTLEGERHTVTEGTKPGEVRVKDGVNMLLGPEDRIAMDAGSHVQFEGAEIAEAKRSMNVEAREATSAAMEEALNIAGKIRPDGLRGNLSAGETAKVMRLLRVGPKGDVSTVARSLSPYFDPAFVVRRGGKVVSIKGLEEYLAAVPVDLRGPEATANSMDQAAEHLYRAEKIPSADIDQMGDYLRGQRLQAAELLSAREGGPPVAESTFIGVQRPSSALHSAPVPSVPAAMTEELKSMAWLRRRYTDIAGMLVRQQRMRGGALGKFLPQTREILLRHTQDSTFWHEAAHDIEAQVYGYGKIKGTDLPYKLTGQAFKQLPFADEFRALGKGMKVTAASSRESEGFAEFVRHYVVDPATAQARAPAAYHWFQNGFAQTSDKAAKIVSDLTSIQAAMTQYREASILDKVLANMASPGAAATDRAGLHVASPITAAMYQIVDDTKPLFEFAERQGIKLGSNPAELVMQMRGWTSRLEHVLLNGTYDLATLNVNGPSLKSVIDTARSADRFIGYSVLRRLVEQVDRPGIKTPWQWFDPAVSAQTITPAQRAQILGDARSEIARIENETPEIRRAADLYARHHHQMAMMLVDSGRIGADDLARMERWYYTPMARFMEDPYAETSAFGGAKQVLAKYRGSDREFINPLVQTVSNDGAVIRMAARNRAHLALAQLIQKDPAASARYGLRMVGPELVPKKALRATVQEIVGKLSRELGIKPADVFDTLGIDEQEAAQQVDFWRQYEKAPEGKQYLRTFNRGGKLPGLPEEFWIEAPTDVRQALSSASTPLEEQAVIHGLIAGGDLFRTATTGNLAFGVFDAVRNAMAAGPMSIAHGAGMTTAPFAMQAQGLARTAAGIMEAGALGTRAQGEYALLAKRLGILNSTWIGQNERVYRKLVREALDPGPKGTIRKIVDALLLEGGQLSEGTRIGEIKAMVDRRGWDIHQLTPDQIAELSKAGREVAVDFRKRGAALMLVSKLTPFLRARIVGTATTYQSMAKIARENPVKFVSLFGGGVIVPSILQWRTTHEEPWYRDIPVNERNTYYHIKAGGTIFRIPRPQELGGWGYAMELAMESMFGNEPDQGDKLVDTMTDAASGYVPFIGHPWGRFLIEKMTGHRFDPGYWARGRPSPPVVPEQYAGLSETPELQVHPGQGWTPRAIAAVPGIGRILGPSPIEVERNVGTLFSTVGRQGMKATDYAASLFGGKQRAAPTASDIPIFGRFVSRETPSATEPRDRLYDDAGRIDRLKASIRAYQAAGDADKAAKLVETNRGLFARQETIKAAIKADRQARAQIHAIQESSLDSAEKRRRIDLVQAEANRVVRLAAGY